MFPYAPLPNPRPTEREYLAWENLREDRNEYVGGEVIPVPAATMAHATIAGNLLLSLMTQLRGTSCFVFHCILKVKAERLGDYFYPDVTVVRGARRFDTVEPNALVNPTLLIEVLSPSTERYDRGKKLVRYRTIESLAEHLLVAQDVRQIDRFFRLPDGSWRHTLHEEEGGPVPLESVGATLDFGDVYARLEGIESADAAGTPG